MLVGSVFMCVPAYVCESGSGVGWKRIEEAHCIYLSGDERRCGRSEGWQRGTQEERKAGWMKG